MKELVKIEKIVIGNEKVNSSNARGLWKKLKSKQSFSNWVHAKVVNNKFFKENVDWVVLSNIIENPKGGRPRVDYALSLNTAEKVALSEQTEVGDMIRQYYIDVRIKYEAENKTQIPFPRNKRTTPHITPEIVPLLQANMEAAKVLGIEHVHAVFKSNQIVYDITGVDCLAEFGNPEYQIEGNSYYMIPTTIGYNVKLSPQKVNLKLEEMGLQKRVKGARDRNVWDLTEEGKKHAVFVYRRKRGAFYSVEPVTQIKWKSSILDLFKEVPVLKIVNS